MILTDNVAVDAFKEQMEDKEFLTITDIGEVLKDLPTLLNTITHFLPQISLATMAIKKNKITLRAIGGTSGEETYTAVELMDKLSISEISVDDALTTARNTINGLIYSPYSDTPMYYTKANNSLLRADCSQIPFKDVYKYLDNAVSMYAKNLKVFMPEVALVEQRKQSLITASQEARGFPNGIEVGMLVRIRDYAAMVAEYGERGFSLTEDVSSELVAASSATYGIPFMKPFMYLRDHIGTVTNINHTTGIIELSCMVDGKNVFKATDITIGDFEAALDKPIVLHEAHIENITEG